MLSSNHTGAVDCGPLPDPANGIVDLSGGTKFGDDGVEYSCNAGYIMSGTATRECLSTGLWSGVEPTCDRKSFILWTPTLTCQEPLSRECELKLYGASIGRSSCIRYHVGKEVTVIAPPNFIM